MADTKSGLSNRKHTLLHYLIELLEKKFPDIIDFPNEISHVDDGSKGIFNEFQVTLSLIRMNMIQIRESLSALKSLLENLEKDSLNLIESATKREKDRKIIKEEPFISNHNTEKLDNQTNQDETFINFLQSFYEESDEKFSKMIIKFKSAETEYDEAIALYGEESKSTTPEEFFGIFNKFKQAYIIAQSENVAAVNREKEEEKMSVCFNLFLATCRYNQNKQKTARNR